MPGQVNAKRRRINASSVRLSVPNQWRTQSGAGELGAPAQEEVEGLKNSFGALSSRTSRADGPQGAKSLPA